jgi:2-keto-4-pentenoate hydratase/2-oxohepta-3-ene-1,7-dioic acid hydratase in catechol pathway
LRALDQLFQALRRVSQFVFVIDEGEIAVIVGDKGVVIPAARHADRAGGYVAFGEQFTLRRGFQQVVIQAKHDVGLAVFAFHAQAIQ